MLPAFTFGIEEEFFLVDPRTGRLSPRAPDLVAAASARLGDRVRGEVTPTQVEVVTPPCTTAAQARAALSTGRRELAACAERLGLWLLASGTPLAGATAPPPLSAGDRYARLATDFRHLLDGQGVCGCHVHIAMPSRDDAVRACDRLRPWLSCLLAMTANSPFADGADTGYASWRSVVAARWPTVGPPPWFGSVARYDAEIAHAVRVGAAHEPRNVYWWIRPSRSFATVEIRIADVLADVEDVIAYAFLLGALAHRDRAAADVSTERLRLQIWRAGRDGLAADVLDPLSGELLPAGQVVDGLADWLAEPHLDGWRDRLRNVGTGADRQRRAFAGGGGPAVVAASRVRAG